MEPKTETEPKYFKFSKPEPEPEPESEPLEPKNYLMITSVIYIYHPQIIFAESIYNNCMWTKGETANY